MNKYIHTIRGSIGVYRGDQIWVAPPGTPLKAILVDSLALIRKQQRETYSWRKAQGFDDPDPGWYHYLRVKV